MAKGDLISKNALLQELRNELKECRATAEAEGGESVLWAEGIEFAIDTVKQQKAAQAVDVDKALQWLEGYTMTDTKQVYSNGCVYVPLYRVKQAFEDRAYNGLLEG